MSVNPTTLRVANHLADAASAARRHLADEPDSPTPGASGASGPSGTSPDAGRLLALLDRRARDDLASDGEFLRMARADGDRAAGPESAVLDAFRERFAAAAENPEAFHALMARTFGAGYDRVAAEDIRQQTLDSDFSWMPRIEVVDAASLADRSGTQASGTALGAYDAAGDRVLLTRELLAGDADLALELLTEEVGHALDARLNKTDSLGDEGELFARLLSGERVSAAEEALIRADDDRGVVLVDGRETEVEYGWFSRARRAVTRAVRDVGEAVGDGVRSVGGLVNDGVDSLNDRVVTPTLESLGGPGRFVNDHLVQPSLGLFQDGVDIGVNTAETAVDIGTELTVGVVEVGAGLLSADPGLVRDSLIETGQNVGRESAGWVVETGAMGLHAASNWIDGTAGLSEVRGLNEVEREHLESIYGDSLDYSRIRIHTGGIKEGIGMDPHVVGNDVFLPEGSFGPDGQLHENGMDLLAHEVGHVWQFQNGGAGYLSSALFSYADDRDAAYDYVTALEELTPWDDLTPDQQAEFAMLIGMAQDAPGGPDVNATSLTQAIQEDTGDGSFPTLADPQVDYMLAIRERLLSGDA